MITMKYVKILLRFMVLISAILSLTNLLDYSIANPIMLLSMSGLFGILAQESYKESKKGQAVFLVLVSILSIYATTFNVYVNFRISK